MKKTPIFLITLTCFFSSFSSYALPEPSTSHPTVLTATTHSTPSGTELPEAPTLGKSPVSSPTRQASSTPPIIPAPPTIEAKGYLLIDAQSGYVITQKNQHVHMAPASLTKLMTMYVVSAALKEGRIKWTDLVPISENAWHTGGSRMFVQVGTQVPVQELVPGIIVASGNDACVAMSEFVAGTEGSFVDLMNQMASQLGMKNTHYADATGLPDPNNYTTPYDLGILSRAIIAHYPNDYSWYSQKWTAYNGIRQPNRNSLLFSDPTVDGLKTGFTDDAGYCLVASAKRQNTMRLIAVIMGATNEKERARQAEALLNYGFRFFETHLLYKAEKSVATRRVWFGEYKESKLGLGEDLYVTVPIGQYPKLQVISQTPSQLNAPLVKGQEYGQLKVFLNKQLVAQRALIALSDNPLAGFFSRLWDQIVSRL